MENFILSNAIITELERLGAKFNGQKNVPEGTEDGPALPGFLGQLLAFDFPKKKQYCTTENTDAFSARFVRFNRTHSFTKEEFDETKHYVAFAEAGGGNYLLCIAIDDSNPADPYVHKFDSEELSSSDGAELSFFLRSLRLQ